MKLKRFAALGLAALMMLSAVGCGQTATNTPTTESKESTVASESTVTSESTVVVEEEKDYTGVTLRFSWWGGDARNTYTTQLIEEWASQYKGLEVEVEYTGFGDHFTRLTTQATAGTMPDVVMMNDNRIATFVSANTLVDLNTYIDQGVIDISKVSESALATGTLEGGLYGMSTGSTAMAMFYEPAALEAAGVTLELEPTWSEILAAADAVYAKTGQKLRVNVFASSNQMFDTWIRSKGKAIFNENMDGYGFTAEDYTEYLEFVYDVLQKESVDNGLLYEGESFAKLQGDVWADITGEAASVISSYEEGSEKELAVCCVPVADDATATGSYLKTAMLWAISENSEQKDLAAEFINFYLNETRPYELGGVDRGVPLNSDNSAFLAKTASASELKFIDYVNDLSTEGLAGPNAVYPLGLSEAQRCLSEVSEQLGYEQLKKEDIAAAAEKAVNAGNDILKTNNTGK